MKRFLKIGFLICIFSFSIFAQTKIETDTDSWNKLKINVTTPEEAIALMGKPSEDSTEKLDFALLPHKSIVNFLLGTDITVPDSWLTPKKNEKIFRKLDFKRSGTYKNIELSFLDNKLYLIDLTFSHDKDERLPAADLEELYKTNFVSLIGIPADASVSDYEGQKEPTMPKVYPIYYAMLSVTPTSILRAFVNNVSTKKAFGTDAGKTKKELFPGFVMKLQIISRIPEKDKNSAQK